MSMRQQYALEDEPQQEATPEMLEALRDVAAVILPGDDLSPSAASLPELPGLLLRAIKAVGPEGPALAAAVELLPQDRSWESVEAFANENAGPFELISAVVASAYFMSPTVLDSLGYPHGPRRPADREQIVNELETGILDPVATRDSMTRSVPATPTEGHV